ncbi:hypothetical protein FDECE_8546 [Fusarium decemcellulare]|nr:hypothetical protein FDECE_8546 [Fusarium decemcellulare]
MPPKRGKGKANGTAASAEKSPYPTFSCQSVRRLNEFAAAKKCAEWHDKASYKCVSPEVPDKYKSNEGGRERKTCLLSADLHQITPEALQPRASWLEPNGRKHPEIHSMLEPMLDSISAVQGIQGAEDGDALPRPVDVINLYHQEPQVKTFVDKMAKHCPTLIGLLLLTPTVWLDGTERQANRVPPAAFMLMHAVQILLFAPVEWNETISYFTNPEDYRHGYPILEGPDQTRVVGGRSSMEDPNRAILILYAFSNRRNGRVNLLQERVPRNSGKTKWSGYHDPTFIFLDDEPAAARSRHMNADEDTENQPPPLMGLEAIDFHTKGLQSLKSHNRSAKLRQQAQQMEIDVLPVMSKVAHRKVIDNLQALHNMEDPVIRLKQTLQTVTHFTNNVDSGTLDTFIYKSRGSSIM